MGGVPANKSTHWDTKQGYRDYWAGGEIVTKNSQHPEQNDLQKDNRKSHSAHAYEYPDTVFPFWERNNFALFKQFSLDSDRFGLQGLEKINLTLLKRFNDNLSMTISEHITRPR